MYKKILATLDGSELAECALGHVKAIAGGCNVPEVILFRVFEPIYIGGGALAESGIDYTQLIDRSQKEAEEYLVATTEKFKQKYGITAKSALAYGRAADEILDYSQKNQIDLIIMTTHGRSGISRWALGSVADRVSRHSKVPVLIITADGCRAENTER